MDLNHLTELAATSGGVLYIMPILLFVTLFVCVERSWFLAHLLSSSRQILARIGSLTSINEVDLRREIKAMGDHPIASVLMVPVQFPNETDRDRLNDLLEEAVLFEVPKLDRSLWVLDTAVTLSPLLGLLGTILGMFNAFQILGSADTPPTSVVGGVAEALIATASGLVVAIIGLVFFNALHARVRLVVHYLETMKMLLINRLVSARAGSFGAPSQPLAHLVK